MSEARDKFNAAVESFLSAVDDRDAKAQIASDKDAAAQAANQAASAAEDQLDTANAAVEQNRQALSNAAAALG